MAQMQQQRKSKRTLLVAPDKEDLIGTLRVCALKKDLLSGVAVHAAVLRKGLIPKSPYVASALINMYAKCGNLTQAHEILEEVPCRDVVMWSAMLSGYAQHGKMHESFVCFEIMRIEGILPDEFILASVLKACAHTKDVEQGQRIHDEIACRALLVDNDDVVLGNALLDMYGKCGLILEAEDVHKELPYRDMTSWNSLISGHVEVKQDHRALICFDHMQCQGFSPDMITFTCILKACGGIGALDKGNQIHNQIVSTGRFTKDIVLGTSLVDMYAKCGAFTIAHQILNELPQRPTVLWNALIGGYTQQGQYHEALKCFEQMQSESLSPDIVTFICIFKACGSVGAVDKGNQIYKEFRIQDLLGKDVALGNALIDMYAKCGMLAKAHEVLEELPAHDVISWNSLIAGYGEQGKGLKALDCFEQMQVGGLCPDEGTLCGVLSACSHSGLLAEAQAIFFNINKMYGIMPNLEHYTCMVVIYGCAGHFDKVVSLVEAMPCFDYHAIWLALLGGCEKWGNVRLGSLAFDQVVQLDDVYTAAYMLMANIFTNACLHADAANVVKYMIIRGNQGHG